MEGGKRESHEENIKRLGEKAMWVIFESQIMKNIEER